MPSLQWIGKEKVINHHQEVPFRVLEHQYGFTAEEGRTKAESGSGNKIIHGDNLEALKALLPEYEGRIKCIYIDPPYNTGEEKWVYNDNVNDPRLLKWLGEVVGKPGEDFTRHDKWLCMMYPRLVLLRQLLTDDGAIFISIDDNEQERLKCLCNEVFGATCFVGDVIWEKNYSPRNDSKGIPTATDHILVYGKQPGWKPKRMERTAEMDEKYKNPDNDVALWRSDNPCAPNAKTHQGMVYAIQHPFTGKMLYPYNGACWRYQQSDMLDIMKGWCKYELRDLDDAEQRAAVCGIAPEEVKEGVKGIVLSEDLETSRHKAQAVYDRGQWPRFYFTNGGQGGIARKTYLDNVQGKLVTTLWPHEEVGHTDGAKKELKAIFGGNIPFDTPKPVSLIERILQIATDDDSIILDSFAGSGTTAHAVLKMNRENPNSFRKFILVELMDYADTITSERVKRVVNGYPYKGKKETELYSKKLTIGQLRQADKLLKEAQAVADANQGKYTSVSNPTIKDNCLKVIGKNVYDEFMTGTSGTFDYYELGATLLNADGNLNQDIAEEKIRQYIYYTETRQPLLRKRSEAHKYLLDTYGHTGYYFYYIPYQETTLNRDTLRILTEQAERYIVYADQCLLPESLLASQNIIFKKIPRDIKQF